MTHTNNKKYFFEIKKNHNNLFYFLLKNDEGSFCLGSHPYTQKNNCKHGIKSVIRNSKNEFRFEVVQDTYEDWYIDLKAGNGKIIAESIEFVTKDELKNFIEDLKCLSPQTPVIDKTK